MKQGHNTKTCDQRLSCRSCKGNHQTAMHGYIPNDKLKTDSSTGQNGHKEIVNNYADVTVITTQENLDKEIISMCIVPVKILHWKNIKKEVLTYAMLDSCSQGSFIQEDLIKELLLSGRKITLNLKTLNGEKTESKMLIKGMDFKGVSGNNSWIKLPKMYTRTKFPVNKEEIATPDKIKQWDYLKVIASDITQTDSIKVGLLIGANYMKAL